jgi:SAM-dependent methyltransferase
MTTLLQLEPSAIAYDRLAPHYDDFTAGYQHDRWIGAIEQIARSLGQRGRRALDIGCGTGRSTGPLFDRGYMVQACDISPEMLAIARLKFPSHSDSFFEADMRELPRLGVYDLVLCLDDALNHLLTDKELSATFDGVSRLLSPTGMFVFDVNSLRTYRTAFANTMIRESDCRFFAWRGEAQTGHEAGDGTAATVEVFTERDDGLWERTSSRHSQRHHSQSTIRQLLTAARLECCATQGQSPGAHLEETVDEDRHTKIVYFVRSTNARQLDSVPHRRTVAARAEEPSALRPGSEPSLLGFDYAAERRWNDHLID